MVKRRKFLIGAGALATGGSAALGTGATRYSANERSSTMDVVADNPAGAIGFNDVSPGDIVNQNGDSEIEIDFAEESGASGVNIGSEFLIGDTYRTGDEIWQNPPSTEFNTGGLATGLQVTESAFNIINQLAGTDVHFKLSYELTGSINSGDASYVAFLIDPEPGYGATGDPLLVSNSSGDETSSGSGVYEVSIPRGDTSDYTFAPGDRMAVGVFVNTDRPDSSTDEDLSGTLTVESVPASQL